MIVSLMLVCSFSSVIAGRRDRSNVLSNVNLHFDNDHEEESETVTDKPKEDASTTGDKDTKSSSTTEAPKGDSTSKEAKTGSKEPETQPETQDCPDGRKFIDGSCFNSCPTNTVNEKP